MLLRLYHKCIIKWDQGRNMSMNEIIVLYIKSCGGVLIGNGRENIFSRRNQINFY